MKALSLLLVSLISLPAFASYERGITRIQGSNYICEIMNNESFKITAESIIFDYTCNDELEAANTEKYDCEQDCEISAYSVKSFEGPEACNSGSVTTPTCAVEFSVTE